MGFFSFKFYHGTEGGNLEIKVLVFFLFKGMSSFLFLAKEGGARGLHTFHPFPSPPLLSHPSPLLSPLSSPPLLSPLPLLPSPLLLSPIPSSLFLGSTQPFPPPAQPSLGLPSFFFRFQEFLCCLF
eukprot:TRINITY_DN3019_c0_g1_i1.p2 TRINITY_DN3019_c0_g1~~TRINITY_DN3019_c0_g1_i1.p2  ORF type:complete len:126 (-),score=34.28 TRINITY_DN3019_c0_g1_i1:11-388(-)